MTDTTANRQPLEALGVFGLFCALTFASRHVPAALHVMALFGLLLPLTWGVITGHWAEMGFTGRNLSAAVAWGIAVAGRIFRVAGAAPTSNAMAGNGSRMPASASVVMPLTAMVDLQSISSQVRVPIDSSGRRGWPRGRSVRNPHDRSSGGH